MTFTNVDFHVKNIVFEFYITHTWASDVNVYLIRNGVNYTLFEDKFGSTNNLGACGDYFTLSQYGVEKLSRLDEEAKRSIAYKLEGNLRELMDKPTDGIWTISIYDDVSSDQG